MKRLLITAFLILVLIEGFFRLAFKITKGYDFFKPRYSFYQDQLNAISEVENTPLNILILGGSAISDALPAKVGIQLQDSLSKFFPQVKVTNFAMPARNSRDMALICSLLSAEEIAKIDYVLYYESINDSRYNCIEKEYFKEDYAHAHWYQELALMEKHPKMNLYFTPFVLDLFVERLKEKTGSAQMLNDDLDISPELIDLGKEIKTNVTFRNNLAGICNTFQGKIPVSLLQYHVYYPEQMMKKENLGFFKEGKYFKAEGPRTTSGAWGYPWNVIMAVNAHNHELENLANSAENIQYMQTDTVLSKIHDEYFDVCHFTEKGGGQFAAYLTKATLERVK